MYPAEAIFPVYCRECWYSDKWDAIEYGLDYDFSKNFFEQLKTLSALVPRMAIWQRNVVNSEYSNMTGESKNVYLSASVVANCENIFYSKAIDSSFNIVDSYNIKNSDNCYKNIDGERNYNSKYLVFSRDCIDSSFLYDCSNCKNCFMSANLQNKDYHIRNKPLTKEKYFEELKKINFGSRKEMDFLRREFEELQKQAIHKYANNIKCIDSTGNNLTNTKKAEQCFDIYDTENTKYCYRGFSLKDCMDFDYGANSELMYEYTTGAKDDYNVKFSYSAMNNVSDAEYTESCQGASSLFGCISIRNKENVILNKVYQEAEFKRLRKEIIAHMNKNTFIGKHGRTYAYGEFLPIELSPVAYNESQAYDFYPLTEEEALDMGYRWHKAQEKGYKASILAAEIADDIKSVDKKILQETLACAHDGSCNHTCQKAFRVIPDELAFYQNNEVPLPDLCPNCRFYNNFEKVLPPKLWHRKCLRNGCPNEFETSYAPDRPEIVYCEQCYQSEVV